MVSVLVTGECSIDIQSSQTHDCIECVCVCVTLSLNSNDLTKNNQDQPAMNQYNPARGDDWAHEKKKMELQWSIMGKKRTNTGINSSWIFLWYGGKKRCQQVLVCTGFSNHLAAGLTLWDLSRINNQESFFKKPLLIYLGFYSELSPYQTLNLLFHLSDIPKLYWAWFEFSMPVLQRVYLQYVSVYLCKK